MADAYTDASKFKEDEVAEVDLRVALKKYCRLTETVGAGRARNADADPARWRKFMGTLELDAYDFAQQELNRDPNEPVLLYPLDAEKYDVEPGEFVSLEQAIPAPSVDVDEMTAEERVLEVAEAAAKIERLHTHCADCITDSKLLKTCYCTWCGKPFAGPVGERVPLAQALDNARVKERKELISWAWGLYGLLTGRAQHAVRIIIDEWMNFEPEESYDYILLQKDKQIATLVEERDELKKQLADAQRWVPLAGKRPGMVTKGIVVKAVERPPLELDPDA